MANELATIDTAQFLSSGSLDATSSAPDASAQLATAEAAYLPADDGDGHDLAEPAARSLELQTAAKAIGVSVDKLPSLAELKRENQGEWLALDGAAWGDETLAAEMMENAQIGLLSIAAGPNGRETIGAFYETGANKNSRIIRLLALGVRAERAMGRGERPGARRSTATPTGGPTMDTSNKAALVRAHRDAVAKGIDLNQAGRRDEARRWQAIASELGKRIYGDGPADPDQP